MLLTFDDGYLTFQRNVLPILELFEVPALLAVCSGWMDSGAPENITAPLMTWVQVKDVAAHPLVTLASHSHDLHKGVVYNPQGNTSHAAASRRFLTAQKRYETEAEHRGRLAEDMKLTVKSFERGTGIKPRAYVWPYGMYNAIGVDEAKNAGFDLLFILNGRKASSARTEALTRLMITENPDPRDFIDELKRLAYYGGKPDSYTRAVHVDLDLLYDEDPKITERNLDAFLNRMLDINPSTVYLQAFADPDGDGNVDAVYFPNRTLPVRADILNRIANQLMIREFRVFVWMPVLSVELPEGKGATYVESLPATASRRYKRLSPFAPSSLQIMKGLYEDLSAHVRFSGVLFQDDATLSDHEDMSPAAMKALRGLVGGQSKLDPQALSAEQREEWSQLKTATITQFTKELAASVRKYKPEAVFARTIYAPVMTNPESETWFAQNYSSALQNYDHVVVMAYPEMEGVRRAGPWLKSLVDVAAEHPQGLEKTIFKLQSYDWNRNKWIPTRTLVSRIRKLVAAGAHHVAYYPDNMFADRPEKNVVRKEMSVQQEMWARPPKPKVLKQR